MKRKLVIISLMMTFVCAFVLGVAAGCNGDKNANVIERTTATNGRTLSLLWTTWTTI